MHSVVQQKVQESHIPERLAHHTAAARDTAAAKVQDLSAQVLVITCCHNKRLQHLLC